MITLFYLIWLFCLVDTSIEKTMKFDQQVTCDLIIAGGSTAALSAAIAAARHTPSVTVCLTEPTDWLGGQLTSSGVSAPDFGSVQRAHVNCLANDFQDMLRTIGNPGKCSVSLNCYQPQDLVTKWIVPTVKKYPNLKVLYYTVIKSVTKSGRIIQSVTAVQRKAKPGADPWKRVLSEEISNWYNVSDDTTFVKTVLHLVPKDKNKGAVFIDATEYGDILAVSGASFRQGIEIPDDYSNKTLDTCGQAMTIVFFIKYNNHSVPPQPLPHPRSQEPYNLTNVLQVNMTWDYVWSWRRAFSGATFNDILDEHENDIYIDELRANVGDISQQNWGNGNDYTRGYLFLSEKETKEQMKDWYGGINITALKAAEDRAYGWYWWFKHNATKNMTDNLSVDMETSGTRSGLVKLPYIRDTRRSIGMDNFMLYAANLSSAHSVYGPVLPDSVAIGNYQYDRHVMLCDKTANSTKETAYTVPFRALTNNDFDNLLVAGKTMAQTYTANAATRLHPTEWHTGQAAGVAAVIMWEKQLTSKQLWKMHIKYLQNELAQLMPVDWKCAGGNSSRIL